MICTKTSFHEGHWLKRLIAETGLSQTEFSRRHGINRGTISQWVIQTNLRFRPHFKVRLARALGMTTAAFDEALMQARSD